MRWLTETKTKAPGPSISRAASIFGCKTASQGGRMREGIVREFGMLRYTPLCLKGITSEDLLYSTVGPLLRVTWKPGWADSLGEVGVYSVYLWLNPSPETYHNIANQLFAHTK